MHLAAVAGSNQRETEHEKSEASSSKHRKDAWKNLAKGGSLQAELEAMYGGSRMQQQGGTSSRRSIPPELQDDYRLDLYGNVVSKKAAQGTMCYFNTDHIFPW